VAAVGQPDLRETFFWPERGQRPATIYGGGTIPGRWYVTLAGAEAAGLDPPALRLA
jgi:hypothetical protein